MFCGGLFFTAIENGVGLVNDHRIIFDAIEWVSAGKGMRYKVFVQGNQRLRLVEFSDGFIEEDWCTQGHAGVVLDGSFSLDYNGHLERYCKDDVIFIPGGEVDKHKALLGQDEKVTLLLFEVLD